MNVRIPFRPLAFAIALACASGAAAAGDVAKDVTDARREAQIWTTYGFNPHLRALDISVEVDGSKATLSGTVGSGIEKDLAEQIAQGTDGIESVDNKLVVDAEYKPVARAPLPAGEREFGQVVEDATITASVKSKLMWNDHTDGLEIDVDTMNGKVTLSGTADTPAAKDLAGRLAMNTSGVRAVDNKLTIDAAQEAKQLAEAVDPSDAWITTKVKSTLLFSRWVDGTDINVDTSNGVVSLNGAVDSGAEKDLAVELSQNIRGVKKVDASGLTVPPG